jgi:hypothetical protein
MVVNVVDESSLRNLASKKRLRREDYNSLQNISKES